MTTKVLHKWIPLPSAPVQTRHIFVMTPQGRGYVWDGTPLNVQIRRDRIAVCFDDGNPATYYCKSEISFTEEQVR